MSSPILVDGTDLTSWAKRRDSQSLLPKLLRQLIHGTIDRDKIVRIGFPAGEGVQLGGWDGIVSVTEGSAFVPEGTSALEMSVRGDIKGKADADYKKRCEDPRGINPSESTYIFVSPRRWGGKEDWITQRQSEGIWKEVRAYDADDLEQWLELSPAVHIWFSIQLGKSPEDTTDIENFWNDWSGCTRPEISTELILSGRDEVIKLIHDWLRNPSAPLALQAGSRDEVLAVFAAAVQTLDVEERITLLSRIVVVFSQSAWNRLTTSDIPIILIQAFDSRDAISRATRSGHSVIIPLGRADSISEKTVTIPRLAISGVTKALVNGVLPEEEARELATLARKSLTSFRRKIALSPEVQQPEWAQPSCAHPLAQIMLVGAWNDVNEEDRKIVSALAHLPYEEVSQILVRWSHEEDPPVSKVGDTWFIVSKEDSWSLLARFLTREDFTHLENAVLEVLGSPDPRFNLPEDQQWMAGAYGHVPRHSDLLSKGLADTLALIGTRGLNLDISTSASASDYVGRIVRKLLEVANGDWKIWASLSYSLSLLAEAAPETFLSAVEEGLKGDDPVILNLFSDQDVSLFSFSPHTGLLYALETLAWNPEYLGHAALVLAKLAKHDPGGKLGNRPQNSLREIFLLWHPQTTATFEQRLRIIDNLREREPEVAWQLLCQLLPTHHDIASPTSTPRWREWAPETAPGVTVGEHRKAIGEIVTRMLSDIGDDGSRWESLIESMDTLPIEQYEDVTNRLNEIEVDRLSLADQTRIWNALRKIISSHRSHPDADWAFEEEQLDKVEETYNKLTPQNLTARFSWLFNGWPELPEGERYDVEKDEQSVEKARGDAVEIIYSKDGVAGLLELMSSVEQPSEVGIAVGRSKILDGEEGGLLGEYLAADDSARMQFARGFASGRIWSRGREWAEGKFSEIATGWSSEQKAEFLARLPNDSQTWDIVEDTDQEAVQHYWHLVRPYGLFDSSDVERAARKLLEHGRPYTAVDLLSLHASRKKEPNPELIAEALEALLQTSPEVDPPLSSFSSNLPELISVLEAAEMIDDNRVASIEWAFLPLLAPKKSPKTLHRELAKNPEFFVEVVSIVFQSEGEEPREASEEEKSQARHGHNLLSSWREIPGTSDDGTIDVNVLRNWVASARETLAASGRGEIGDQMFGQVLSGSPEDKDGCWPHAAVRDMIEEVASAELELGLEIGLYNSRGVVTKQLREGGVQEHSLAERYISLAAAVSDRWPRTAAMLRRISDHYRSQGRAGDSEAELMDSLDRW